MTVYTNDKIFETITNHCKENTKRKNFQYHYLYIVSYLYNAPHLDRRFTAEDFIPVNTEVMRSIISKQETTAILNNLISLGVIEKNSSYIVGKKSIGYKITPSFKAKMRAIPVKDEALKIKYMNRKEQLSSKLKKEDRGYQIVNYWLHELRIDHTRAKKYNNNHNIADAGLHGSNVSMIELLQKQEFFSVVDTTSKRFHNNLTNLSTKMRKFLSINDQPLWQVDIANSQPLFLYLVLKDRNISQDEMNKYRDSVVSGQFYESLAAAMNSSLDLTDFDQRKEFKKKIFGGVLFDRNRSKLSKYEITFKAEYPEIFETIRGMKAGGYKQVAIALQKAESKFIFEAVKSIDNEFKGQAPILTIHDSICSTEDYIYMIEQIMQNKFETEFDVSPSLSATKF